MFCTGSQDRASKEGTRMSVSVTPHSKGGKHVGFKKMVGARLFHLVTGTSDEHRRRAERLAQALVDQWTRLGATGCTWSDEAIAVAYDRAGETRLVDRRLPPPQQEDTIEPVESAVTAGPLL